MRAGSNPSGDLFESGGKAGRARSATELNGWRGSAADAGKADAIALHLAIRLQPGAYIIKEAGCVSIGRLDDSVMHPLPVASRGDDSGAAEVTEMPRYLRLAGAEDSDEEAHADLISAHQVNQPQPCSISQSLEKPLAIEPFLDSPGRSLTRFIHNRNFSTRTQICLDICILSKYSPRTHSQKRIYKINKGE